VAGEPKIVAYSFREVEFNPDGAIADYTDAIRQKPNVAEYYMKRAYAYNIKKDYDRAISDYSEVLRLGPTTETEVYKGNGYTIGKVDDYSVMVYNNRGIMYIEKGNYDRAISDFNELIRLNPNEAATYNNRGVAYYKKEVYERAIADYTEAIRLNPNYAEAYKNRGLASYSYQRELNDGYTILYKGYYNEAISDFTQAIQLGLKDVGVYFFRGTAYSNEGHNDKAISDFNEVIRLDPNDTLAYYQRGIAYNKKGDYNKAISDFTQAIRFDPNEADSYSGRGYAYRNKKDYKKAIADFESALRINPDYPFAKEVLEEIREEMGEAQSGVPSSDGGVSGNMFTDSRDSKKYKTVKIGFQTWMAENLNYAASGSVCYKNNSGNCAKYGRLYDWNTAKNACPSGWHLPSKSEYEELDKYVGGANVAGKKLKAKSGWNDNGNGTDDYGFSALPAGGYSGYDERFLSFGAIGYAGNWWSTSERENTSNLAYSRVMHYNSDTAYWGVPHKSNFNSVRCIKD